MTLGIYSAFCIQTSQRDFHTSFVFPKLLTDGLALGRTSLETGLVLSLGRDSETVATLCA